MDESLDTMPPGTITPPPARQSAASGIDGPPSVLPGPTLYVTLVDGGPLEPLPFPVEDLVDDLSWYDPPLIEREELPPVKVRVIDGGPHEPLPFPVEDLDPDWDV